MSNNERLLLFAISMGLVLLVAVILWLQQEISMHILRKTMTREDVMTKFCSGRHFDLDGLMRVFRVSPHPHDVECGENSYTGCLGKRIRLIMHREGDFYILDDIQRYRDANWQFTGWYDEYERRRAHDKTAYIVAGEANYLEAQKHDRLPGFILSAEAVKKIFDEFREGAN